MPAISISGSGTRYTQDFDSLANTAGSTTNALTIPGWALAETGGGARDNDQYGVDTGGSTTGDTYSYGTAGATDRALGSLRSGTLIPVFGANFGNDTGGTITALNIGYTGEQWRLGTAGRADRLDFQISYNATSVDDAAATWTDFDQLDFSSLVTTAPTGALDGNAAANRGLLSFDLTGLNIAAGTQFWIRWVDADASSSDDGLAIDDFELTATAAGALPGLSIADVSVAEGNAGTSLLTFTVSLGAPAGAGGVSFDIATANDSAAAGSDYVAAALTGQTIAAGATSATFSVTINGDTTSELDESFFVNVTNVTGANVLDGQATGTITNDDAQLATLSISDPVVTEGDAGTTVLSYTVTSSIAAPAGGISFDIATAGGTATAGSDYVARSVTGATIAAGDTTYTFDVTVNGDTASEPSETVLVNLSNPTNAAIADAQGIGTITNDDITFIHDIQGSSYFSPLLAASGVTSFNTNSAFTVTVQAVVTAVDGVGARQGFYITEQTADWDMSDLTSEGIFVMTRNDSNVGTTLDASLANGVQVGDVVTLTANIMEYQAFQSLPRTVLTNMTGFSVGPQAQPLPTVTLDATRPIPNEILTGVTPDYRDTQDDLGDSFDATNYAMSYFETIEGMLVTVPDMRAADGFYTTSGAGGFFQAYSGVHANPDQLNDRGGYTIAGDPPVGPAALDSAGDPTDDTQSGGRYLHDGDVNPDVIEVDFTDFAAGSLPAGIASGLSMGDRLGDLTGIIDFDFTDRKLFVTQTPTLVDNTQTVETTALAGSATALTFATFNVENLTMGDPQAKFDGLAGAVAQNLGLPDILSIEEIQDNNGTGTGVTDASQTWDKLVAAINARAETIAAGANYQWVDELPVNNAEGGAPNGNIRVGFLYNTARVQLGDVAANATIADRRQFTDRIGDGVRDAGDRIAYSDAQIAGEITAADWATTRKSLLGEFTFNGQTVYVMSNHLPSKGGSGQFWQLNQELTAGQPENAGWQQRSNIAQDLWTMMNTISSGTAGARIISGGDFNDFQFYRPLLAATGYVDQSGAARTGGARFDNLTLTLPEAERYTYAFDGRNQAIDHVLVSQNLGLVAQYDVVHLNTGFNRNSDVPLSDHDPAVARFDFAAIDNPPVLVSSTPADNAAAVAVGADIVLTFNEAVQAGTGNIILRPASGADIVIAVTDAQVTFNGTTVTINPTADLRPGVAYDVIVAQGVITDANGNAAAAIAADALDFTTAAGVIPSGSFATTFTVATPGSYVLAAGETRTQTAGGAVAVTATGGAVTIDIQGSLVDTVATQRTLNFANNTSGSVTVGQAGVIQSLNGDAFRNQSTGGTVNLTNLGQIISTTSDATVVPGGPSPNQAFAVQYNAALGTAGAPLTDFTSGGVITNGSTSVTTALIRSDTGDAVRLGSHMTLVNYGTIDGNGPVGDSSSNNAFNTPPTSTAEAYDTSRGVRINQNNAVSTRIDNYGRIEGTQHAVDIGQTTVSGADIINRAGGMIVGLNGSGVGADTAGVAANTVTVTNSGTIRGGYTPGFDRAGLATVDGDGDGVDIDGGATIVNNAGAVIEGVGKGGFDNGGRSNNSEGISIGGGVITNAGTIRGADRGIIVNNDSNANGSRSGVAATTVTNNAGGAITGDAGFAIRLENKTGTAADDDSVANYGTITGNGTVPDPAAIVLRQDGNPDPGSVGTLDGVTYTGTGVARFIRGDGSAIQTGEGNDTLVNYGTITGNSGRAINLEGGTDTLTLYTGQTIVGRIDGGAGSDTLTLRVDDRTGGDARGPNSGSLTGTIAQAVNFETLAVAGGTWSVTDQQFYAGGVSIAGGAALRIAGAATPLGTIANDGALIFANTADVTAGAINGSGTVVTAVTGVLTLSTAGSYSGGTTLQGGTLSVIAQGAAGSGAITFANGAQTLRIDGTALGTDANHSFANTVTGFASEDRIDLTGVAAASASYNAGTNRLTLLGSTSTVVATLQLSGSYAGQTFAVASNGAGGSIVSVAPTPTPGPTPTPTPVPTPTPTPGTGTPGADTLIAASATATLVGGAGNDVYLVRGQGNVLVENGGEGFDTAFTTDSFVLPNGVSIEFLSPAEQGGTAPINLTGNAFDQTIAGNLGDNILNGGGGSDTLIGLGGNDTFLVRGPGDVVIEDNSGGNDTVFTTASYNLGANEVEYLSTVTHTDTTPIALIGNFASQTLIGNYGDNLLNGGSGADTLIGLFGNDLYAVGDSRIQIVDQAGQGADTVVASVSYTLGAAAEVEVLAAQDRSATTALDLTGNGFAQTVAGNAGANRIDGGGGADTLIGGGGADVFAFTAALDNANVDTIADFAADDRIALSRGVFTAIGAGGGLAVGAFATGTAAADADDRIVYDQASGRIFYDADGNGAGQAILFAIVTPGAALSAANFEAVIPA